MQQVLVLPYSAQVRKCTEYAEYAEYAELD